MALLEQEALTAGDDTATEPSSLFARLKTACSKEWEAYVNHRFVQLLATGALEEADFQRYLIQDYLFLLHFARAYGLAVFKGETLEDMRHAARGLAAIIDQELALHVGYCRRWQLDETTMAATPEADATLAYTRYVLERGLAGDLLDLYCALAPCIVGYAEIGRWAKSEAGETLSNNPYAEWIETYAAGDYQEVANAHVEQMNRLNMRRGGESRFPSLATTFRQATRLEAGFWEMALMPR